ncbi:MAG: hypothetical protein J5982_03425 [Bacilli bacterium]|nr:hypothetical protein [Bacilli bacterium]
MIRCKDCKHCKQIGRSQIQRGNWIGRARYYCENPLLKGVRDKQGYPLNTFIGFGDNTLESPLSIKSCKKWCPLKKEVSNNEKNNQ